MFGKNLANHMTIIIPKILQFAFALSSTLTTEKKNCSLVMSNWFKPHW